MKDEERTYISAYVPVSLAERFKKMKSEGEQYKIIEEIIEGTKKSLKTDLEAMDEDVLRFKGMLLAYKGEYKKVLDAHNEAVYKVWEDIDANLPSMREKAQTLIDGISDIMPAVYEILKMVKEVSSAMESVNTYQLSRMVELVESVNQADDKTKDLLRFMLAERAK